MPAGETVPVPLMPSRTWFGVTAATMPGGAGDLRRFPFIVLPGLVPGIHFLPPASPLPARTAMPQDVGGGLLSGWGPRRSILCPG